METRNYNPHPLHVLCPGTVGESYCFAVQTGPQTSPHCVDFGYFHCEKLEHGRYIRRRRNTLYDILLTSHQSSRDYNIYVSIKIVTKYGSSYCCYTILRKVAPLVSLILLSVIDMAVIVQQRPISVSFLSTVEISLPSVYNCILVKWRSSCRQRRLLFSGRYFSAMSADARKPQRKSTV